MMVSFIPEIRSKPIDVQSAHQKIALQNGLKMKQDEAPELVRDVAGRIEQHGGDPVEVEDPLPARPILPERPAEQHELDETIDLRHGEGERVRVDRRDAAVVLDQHDQLDDVLERVPLLVIGVLVLVVTLGAILGVLAGRGLKGVLPWYFFSRDLLHDGHLRANEKLGTAG